MSTNNTDTPMNTYNNKEFEINNTKKRKKNRCCFKGCKKKLSLVCFECLCGLKFCTEHRLPEFHNCTFDFKTQAQIKIKESNPLIINEKITKI